MEIILERYCKDYDITMEVAKEHEIELKKYLTLCALFPKSSMGMRGQVDELWHTFLLFTRDYHRFCKNVVGHFIHHIPNTSKSNSEISSYREMLNKYEECFEIEPPKHIWPSIKVKGQEESMDACGTSCDTCGRCSAGCGAGCQNSGCGSGGCTSAE